ncbi:peptidylprolyl isomerase [Solimonas soli]|uniref:peptidylprolyl isomerase n=1 Tax=Solimonas soli TaxID=413479 RepID=UPI0004BBF924|nr:peptidylprolyl isomerase [Solimonas soli]
MFRYAKPLAFAAVLATGVAAAADKARDKTPGAAGDNGGLAADLYVNGQPISVNHVSLMAAGIGQQQKDPRQAGSEESRNAARAELITEEVLAQAARKKGLDRKPEIADQLAYQQRLILSRAYLEDYFTAQPINDDTLRAAYEWNRANGKIREYHVRHILTGKLADAQAALAALDKGEDFAAVAKRYTLDPGGQENGGDLGWFRPDIFVDHHFSDAVESLKKGEYSKTPVRSRYGWHVIKLEEGPRPVAKPQPYDALDDSAREALRQRTAQLKIEELTAQLSKNAKVTGPGAAGSATARSGQ